MQREALDRQNRFKQEAERRLAAIDLEEKQREREINKERFAIVKKRQQETLIKLQAVYYIKVGKREKRYRSRGKKEIY